MRGIQWTGGSGCSTSWLVLSFLVLEFNPRMGENGGHWKRWISSRRSVTSRDKVDCRSIHGATPLFYIHAYILPPLRVPLSPVSLALPSQSFFRSSFSSCFSPLLFLPEGWPGTHQQPLTSFHGTLDIGGPVGGLGIGPILFLAGHRDRCASLGMLPISGNLYSALKNDRQSETCSLFEHVCSFPFFFFSSFSSFYIDTNRNYTHVEIAIYTDSDPLRFYSAVWYLIPSIVSLFVSLSTAWDLRPPFPCRVRG